MELTETQDHVSEPSWIEKENEEEMEELSLIPNARNEPRWTLHMCDNKCRKEDIKFHQLVTIVTEEQKKENQRTRKICTIRVQWEAT